MIRIMRGRTSFDRFKAYKIYIDGVYRGDIWNSETKEFEVENGSHVVRARVDWGGSNKAYVHVNSSIVELEVGSVTDKAWTKAAWMLAFPIVVLLYATVLSQRYLWLKENFKDADNTKE